MFGLEKASDKSKLQTEKDLYDLEVRIRNAGERRKLKDELKMLTQQLKGALRKGGEQKEFDELGLLLSAVSSMDKLVDKVARSFERTKK